MNLNRQTLSFKTYAEIVFIGDAHLGSTTCNVQKFKDMVKYCTENKLYVFCMGDMIEAANRYSVGSGVYEQDNPESQVAQLIEILSPLADAHLIVGYLTGNHEDRISKAVGIDISKLIAKSLSVPYLGYAGWTIFYVGDYSYTLYAHHGTSSSTTLPSKVKSILSISNNEYADIIAMGHVHETWVGAIEKEYIDKKRKTLETKRVELLLTGHYLNYDGYPRIKAYSIGKQGSPKLKLFGNKWDIHTSI